MKPICRSSATRRAVAAASAALLLGLPGADEAAGQSIPHPSRAGHFTVTAEIGGAAFSDFQRAQARPSGVEPGLGEFRRRISAKTSATLGLRAAYWFSNTLGVRVGGSYAPSGFSVWNEDRAQRLMDERSNGEQPRYAGLGVWFADATMLVAIPTGRSRVGPYLIGGGGLVRYRASSPDSIPPEAHDGFAGGQHTTAAAVLGAGATIPLERNNLLLAFEVTNHISRTPLGDRAVGRTFELAGVPLRLDPETAAVSGNDVGLTSNLRLTVGLTLPFR